MKGGFDHERAARVLVDAIAVGDRTAAKRHGVSEKTVGRYRKRLLDDPKLAELVREKGREADQGWHFARARFLRRTLKKLDRLVQTATKDDFEHLINALKAAGELDLATEALGVGVRAPQQGPPAAADQGAAPGSAAADEAEDDEG